VYLANRARSLEKQVNKLLFNLNRPGYISISDVATLDRSSGGLSNKRKRFVDSITSAISRSSTFRQDSTGANDPITILVSGLGERVSCKEVTAEITSLCQDLTAQFQDELDWQGAAR